jgi:outer membrane protein assembly factor BamA
VLLPAIAVAQPVATDEQTASTVEQAPAPGEESGRVDTDPGESTGRIVLRGALAVPKAVVNTVFLPIEGGAWAYERYQIGDRAMRLFFNDAGTIGLVPTLKLESGFGVNVGARFVHRDVFGGHEYFGLRASTGGRFHERVAATFRTGNHADANASLQFRAEYERRPRDSFYGVGNADEQDVDMPIDPLAGNIASRGRYRHRIARATGTFDRRIVDELHVRVAAQVADHLLAGSDTSPSIDSVFDMDTLVGIGRTQNAYGEVELRYDSRRRASSWEPLPVPATGWLAAGFVGRSTALDQGADFFRYGADVQKFICLGVGPRVLSVRLHGEAVSAPASAIPFIELPAIGGDTTLRGYAVDRFRDRAVVSGSAQYQWDIARTMSASLFVDVGQVAGTVRDLDTHDLRVGYGIALDAHTPRSYLLRTTIASSVDGGVFFNVDLDPVFELEARTERR